jgi:hypothetical protein
MGRKGETIVYSAARATRGPQQSGTGLAVGDHLSLLVVVAGSTRSAPDERLPGRVHRVLPWRLVVSGEAAAASPHRRSPPREPLEGRRGRRSMESQVGGREEGLCSFGRDETELMNFVYIKNA